MHLYISQLCFLINAKNVQKRQYEVKRVLIALNSVT